MEKEGFLGVLRTGKEDSGVKGMEQGSLGRRKKKEGKKGKIAVRMGYGSVEGG